MFTWKQFLADHRIRYVTTGPNVKAGNINIKCPFCGDADPSEHLGLNLRNSYWGCWRVKSHRGKNPRRLIMRLLGCSYEVADGFLTGERELDRFEDLAKSFKSSVIGGSNPDRHELMLPKDFRCLTSRGLGRYYTEYLRKRGFGLKSIPKLVRMYDLRFCTQGYWRGRIIFPVVFEGDLVCWTGRTIYPDGRPRYQSLSEKEVREGQPKAVMNIKKLIWNYDVLLKKRYKVLAVMEGPMDALKIDFYGRRLGVRGTCLFGTGITQEQKYLLTDLRDRCDHLVAFSDQGALLNEMELQKELSEIDVEMLRPPSGVEDPGAMNREQITDTFKAFV